MNDLHGLELFETDTLSEIGNIAMGAAATALSVLLDRKVNITTPRVTLTDAEQVRGRFPIPCVVVRIHFSRGLTGDNLLIIREKDAAAIAGMMMGTGNESAALDELGLSALAEAMNQMMGSSATALSEMFARQIEISPPNTEYQDFGRPDSQIDLCGERLVQIAFHIEVEGLVDSELVKLVPLEFAREMIRESLAAVTGAPPADAVSDAQPEPQKSLSGGKVYSRPQPGEARAAEGGPTLQLNLIRDVPVRVTGILGRRVLPLKDLISMANGAVVDLDCAAEEPVEILANGKLIARGEVVVVNDAIGLKIKEIIHPWQRNWQ